MKAIMKYPGSKWSMAKRIINLFPEHHSYLEPFFGSGAVLFNKPRSNIETVNDLDGNVVNLFEWIKKDPEQLAHEIYYTPYARQTYEDAFSAVPEDGLEKAVNFGQLPRGVPSCPFTHTARLLRFNSFSSSFVLQRESHFFRSAYSSGGRCSLTRLRGSASVRSNNSKQALFMTSPSDGNTHHILLILW